MKESIENILDRNLYSILEKNINIPIGVTDSILNIQYKKENEKGYLGKVAIVFSLLVITINIVASAYRIHESYKEKSSIGYVNDSLQKTVDNGYIQNVDMEYMYSNNVGAKIDYIIMSDYNLNILFNFNIEGREDIKREANIQDLLIYDENNNIIYCYNYKKYKNFCKKNNIKYTKNIIEQYVDGNGIQLIELSSSINRTLYTMRSIKGFPKSRKLYLKFSEICFDIDDTKVKGNWNFELNLNEKFYNREYIEYELESSSNEINLISAKATTTTMRIIYEMKSTQVDKVGSISMYIEDRLGNRYEINDIEDSISVYKNEISATFPITTEDKIEGFILYISIDKKDYFSVVLRKKE